MIIDRYIASDGNGFDGLAVDRSQAGEGGVMDFVNNISVCLEMAPPLHRSQCACEHAFVSFRAVAFFCPASMSANRTHTPAPNIDYR